MDLKTTGMEFASEMVIKSTLKRLKISEVPVTLHPDGRSRPPHLKPWRDGWRHLRFMLLYSPRWLFLYPGLALTLAGLVGVAAILPSPAHLGSVVLDINTLLFAVAGVQAGVQAMALAVCAKAYAIQCGLRPAEAGFDRLMGRLTLEAGLVVGGALGVAGIAAAIGATLYWRGRGFGNLDPEIVTRWVIGGVGCLGLGCQVILNSLFVSILGLKFSRG